MGGKTGTTHQPSFRSRVIAVLSGLFLAGPVFAGVLGLASPGGYGLKIYRADYSLYPFVQVYFRTFDHKQQPLVNLNVLNIGLMVKGRAYDP